MESTTQIQTQPETKMVPGGAARIIWKVKKQIRRKFSAENKIKIVLEGYRKEIPVAALYRWEKISAVVYEVWLKEFMEGGTLRSATTDEVSNLQHQHHRTNSIRVAFHHLILRLKHRRYVLSVVLKLMNIKVSGMDIYGNV